MIIVNGHGRGRWCTSDAQTDATSPPQFPHFYTRQVHEIHHTNTILDENWVISWSLEEIKTSASNNLHCSFLILDFGHVIYAKSAMADCMIYDTVKPLLTHTCLNP